MESLEMNTMPSNEMVRPEEKIDVNAACVNIISRVLSMENNRFTETSYIIEELQHLYDKAPREDVAELIEAIKKTSSVPCLKAVEEYQSWVSYFLGINKESEVKSEEQKTQETNNPEELENQGTTENE